MYVQLLVHVEAKNTPCHTSRFFVARGKRCCSNELVGTTTGGGGKVSNSYFAGRVEVGSQRASGIVALQDTNDGLTIENCLSAAVELVCPETYRVASVRSGYSTMTNNYALSTLTSTRGTEAERGIDASEEELHQQAFYADGLTWTFGADGWQWHEGTYPLLGWQQAAVASTALVYLSGLRPVLTLKSGELIDLSRYYTSGGGAQLTYTTSSDKVSINGSIVTVAEGIEIRKFEDVTVYASAANLQPVGITLSLVPSVITISSAEDLIYFAGLVNEGQTTLNGNLTADIDLTGESFTRIGTRTHKYAGAFDGQGHSVTLDMNITGTTNDDKCQGLFGCATGGASFSNLIIKGSITCKANCVAALVGETNGSGTVTISNVGCEASVNATSNYVGAFLGNNSGGNTKIVITNCYNTGNITSGGNNFSVMGGYGSGTSTYANVYNTGIITGPANATGGKFVQGNNGTCTNCYTTEAGSQSGLTTGISAASISSGELCYKLGSAFRQVLGEGGDDYPVLDTSKPSVYQLTVSDAGYASFVPEVNVAAIPKGVEVYVGEDNGSYLHLEKVTEVPADNAFVVKAEEGNYYYNNTDAARSLNGATNNLTFSPVAFTSDGTQYCLSNKASGVGFYVVNSGITIPARKVYLAVPAPVKAFYGFDFDDDATGINEELRMKNEESSIYDLAGQRIDNSQFTIHNSQLKRGIYIVNGKKILK